MLEMFGASCVPLLLRARVGCIMFSFPMKCTLRCNRAQHMRTFNENGRYAAKQNKSISIARSIMHSYSIMFIIIFRRISSTERPVQSIIPCRLSLTGFKANRGALRKLCDCDAIVLTADAIEFRKISALQWNLYYICEHVLYYRMRTICRIITNSIICKSCIPLTFFNNVPIAYSFDFRDIMPGLSGSPDGNFTRMFNHHHHHTPAYGHSSHSGYAEGVFSGQ